MFLVLFAKVVLFISFGSVQSQFGDINPNVTKVTHNINTTECSWKARSVSRFHGNITMHHFEETSFNHGPHVYGVCTFTLWEPLNITSNAVVDIVGRHSLSIHSNESIRVSAALDLGWSPARNRTDMWLGGFCSRNDGLNETIGCGPGGGSCYGSAGHGGMGLRFERQDGMKYGWRYAFHLSKLRLIGGSSGGVVTLGSGWSCGGGAIQISSETSVTVDANISTNAYNLFSNDSCINGASGGTIIINATLVNLTRNAILVSRGAPEHQKINCSTFSGSGGVIVINGTIIGHPPDPHNHTGPEPQGSQRRSYGIVIINGVSKDRLPALTINGKGYKGCYSKTNDKAFNYSVLQDYQVRPFDCKRRCKACGYLYAVHHVKLCTCANALIEMTNISDWKCSLRCFARENIRCGGQNKTNMFYVVYETNTSASNSVPNISTPESCPARNVSHSYCKFRPRTNLTSITVAPTATAFTDVPAPVTPAIVTAAKVNPSTISAASVITTPVITTTEITTSAIATLEIATPGITTPGITTPVIATPVMATPEITAPGIAILPITPPVITTPEIATPVITTEIYTTETHPTTRRSDSQKTSKLKDLLDVSLKKNDSANILNELNKTIAIGSLSANDLNLSLAILEKIVQKDAICSKNKTECKHVGQLVLNIAENILNSTASSWNILNKEEKRCPEILLKLVEQTAARLGKSLHTNETLNLNSSNFGLRIEHVDPSQLQNRTYVFIGLDISKKKTDFENDEDEIAFLPASLLQAINGSGPFNLHLLKYRPNSLLVNASSSNSRPLKQDLKDKVALNFPHSKIPTKRSCRFLDFEKISDISWSTRGCVVGSNKERRTECLCNHFTSFAVLTDIEQVPIDEVHLEALSWITYLGCTISLLCLVATLTTFAVLQRFECDHIWIHCNLITSLTLAQLVFIFGIKATDIKVVCQGIAIILHYLYTAAIFWMCIEGIHLYRKVVKVFMQSFIKKHYYIFGWGGPAIIVLISGLLRFDGFGNEKACWLSIENGLIWAFVVPVLFLFLVNLTILLLVVRIMLGAVNTIPPNGQKNSSIRNGVKGVISLLPILGLTWVFGVLAVNSLNVVFQYVFTLLNSLQGFFIFLFHCVFNKDVRAAVKKRRQRQNTVQRWSNDLSWKSKDHIFQKGSLQSSRVSSIFVQQIDVKPSPEPSRNADFVQ